MRVVTKTFFILLTGIIFTLPLKAQSTIQPAEKQIEAALAPLPEAMRDGSSVFGYSQNGDLTMLRERDGELICLADDPADERFHVACYHKDLEPFMQRGRTLRAEGMTTGEVRDIRREEIEAGTLPMPEKPMSLYSLTGDQNAYDYSTGTLLNASPLYVVYVPFATVETTGLASSPASTGAPWLMDAGAPWAHIMVGTGRQVGENSEDSN